MSVARGWQFFMHPGPTNIPHRVLQAMQRPAVDFTGPWEEVPAFIDAGDVFAMPCRTRLLGLEAEA